MRRLAKQARRLRDILAQEPARKGYRVTEAVMRANLPGVGAEVHLSRQPQQEQPGLPLSIEDVMAPLVALAAEGETGIVLTVDEAQDAGAEELRALATFHQRAVEANWPVVLLVAGLPPLRTGGLKSSFERADWFDIGPLSPSATLTALAEPAVRAGRPTRPVRLNTWPPIPEGTPTPYSSTATLPGASPKASPSSPPAPSTWPSRLPVRSSSATSTASAGSARLPGNASTWSPWPRRSQQAPTPPAPRSPNAWA